MMYHRDPQECPTRVLNHHGIERGSGRLRSLDLDTGISWECPGHQPPDPYQQVLDALPSAKWFEKQLATGEGLDRERMALHIWGNLVMVLQAELTAGGEAR